jgi:hypothetical protein
MSKMEGIGKHSRLKLSKVISKSKEGLTQALVESVLNVNKQEAGRRTPSIKVGKSRMATKNQKRILY